MIFSIPQIMAALGLVSKIAQAGTGAWMQIKMVLASHGYAEDTAELDALIEDATRRKAIAEAEARG